MNKLNNAPYAKFLRKDELKKVLSKEVFEGLKYFDDNDLFGVVIDIKALDKIDSKEMFLEYTFGKSDAQK